MKHSFGTVDITIIDKDTEHEDTLTDLINAYAIVGFTAGRTEGELVENAKNVIAEQFLQGILQSNKTKT